MAVQGLSALDYVAQPDFVARQSENGAWTASQSFIFQRDDLDNYSFRAKFPGLIRATDLDEGLPDYWAFLRLINVDVEHKEAGCSTIRAHYSGTAVSSASGSGTGEQAEVITYTLAGTVKQRSILEHPSVVALVDEERKKLGMLMDGDIYWHVEKERYSQETTLNPWGDEITFTAGDSLTFADKIAQGIVTFDSPSYTWTERKERTAGLTSSELNDLGKVSKPAGSPPEAGGTRDWKLVSATQDFDGNTYHMTRVWELSERGRWDGEVYDY